MAGNDFRSVADLHHPALVSYLTAILPASSFGHAATLLGKRLNQ